jgi:hypothetical protein
VKLLRSLGAILAGFVVVALVIGILTPVVIRAFRVENFNSFSLPVLVATIGYCVVAAIAGGYLTAWIAGRRELPHAAGLGLLMIAMSVVSMRQHGEVRPGWYETTIAGCGPVAAFFGAAIRRLTKGR